MPISPHLLRKLQDALGHQAAEEVVSRLDGSESFPGDMAEFRHEMQLAFTKVDVGFAEGRAALEKGLKEQTRVFFVAWATLLVFVVGLYGFVVALYVR